MHMNELKRVQVNSRQVSLFRKLASDSAILTWAGSSFHHCGARVDVDMMVTLPFPM